MDPKKVSPSVIFQLRDHRDQLEELAVQAFSEGRLDDHMVLVLAYHGLASIGVVGYRVELEV